MKTNLMPFVLVYENEEFIYNGERYIRASYCITDYNAIRVYDGHQFTFERYDIVDVRAQ